MTDFSPLDFPLPERTGHETVEQRLAALEETVPRLLEALQYTLANLGAENFNAVALSRLVSPIHARIDGADGDIAQLSLDANALNVRLTSAEGNVAALEQTVSDQGARIALVADADGVNAASIVAAINNYDFTANTANGEQVEIIAASVRSANHVTQCALMGADIATVPFGVLKKMVQHPLTDRGLDSFMKDWEKVANA